MEEIRSKKEIIMKITELEKELMHIHLDNTKKLIRTKINTLKLVLKIRSKQEVIMKISELEKELGYRYADDAKEFIRAKIEAFKWTLC